MKRLILITLAAVALAAPAKASDGIHCQYSEWYGVNCNRTYATPPVTLTRAEREAEQAALDAKIAKWENFCKPTKTTDSEGLTRLTYAQKGCEFGRDQ